MGISYRLFLFEYLCILIVFLEEVYYLGYSKVLIVLKYKILKIQMFPLYLSNIESFTVSVSTFFYSSIYVAESTSSTDAFYWYSWDFCGSW